MPGGEPQPDLIFARMREYLVTHGRTPELRRLRDQLEFPGGAAFWDPFDIWDPSHGGYGVGMNASPDHGL